MNRLLQIICVLAVVLPVRAAAQSCNPVITSDRTGLAGTTAGQAWDGNNVSFFRSSFDNWQYLQVDFTCVGQLSSIRRYMTRDGVSVVGARASQGEAVSYSMDGVTWINVAGAATTGWGGYVQYSPTAWHTVPYGWSASLRLNTPVQARFVRFRWDGDNDALNEVEFGFLTPGSSVPPPYPVAPPDCPTFTSEPIFPVYFQGLHGTDATHMWAVGDSRAATGFGIIRFFNGQIWQTQVARAAGRLNAVFAASASAVWAAGDGGFMLVTTNGGQTWLQQSTPTAQHLNDLAAASPTVLWAVGSNGTILNTRNGGQVWNVQTSGTTQSLSGVAAVSGSEAWAVGANGTILHTRDGGAFWGPESSGLTTVLSDVMAMSPTEVWAVGEGGHVVRTTNGGGTWVSQNSGTTEWLAAVARDLSGGLWIAGANGTMLRSTNGMFQTYASGTTERLTTVFGMSATTAWASSHEAENLLLQWNAGSWQRRSEVLHQNTLYDMTAPINNKEVWATGALGAIIYSPDRGMTWRTLYAAPSGVLFSVVVTPQRHIWAAGSDGSLNGVVAHYDGVRWQTHNTGFPVVLRRVAAATPRHAWAVGASRTILFTDSAGQSWTRQTIPGNVPAGDFMDVLAISDREAWVVGEGGVMLRTTNGGQTWVLQPSQTPRNLWSISMTPPNEIWIAGASGTILRYDGVNWTSTIGATVEPLNAISATPSSGVWSVGVNGTLLGFDGLHWYRPPSNTTDNLRSLSVIGSITGLDLWVLSTQAFGVNPAILQYGCR